MGCINRLLLFFLPLLVSSDTCNDQIRLNGRQQQQSSVYCSSCSTYIDGQTSAPIVQLELPSLTKLSGIFVQSQEGDTKLNSYFLEYRRTQDGPWRAYGQRQQRKLFIERIRLYFNDRSDSNETRTFLPLIIARQIRLIFVTSSVSTCAIIKIFGCQSQNGLISTRFSQRSIVNHDFKYDGLITNSTARGGLGILTDGDIHRFLHWSRSSEPILLSFAFDSIRQFQSINLDLKCYTLTCTLRINIGIFEIVTSKHLWTNRFRSIEIDNKQSDDNTTITHLVLALSKIKGQFVIIQINTNQDLALSEITFNNENDNDEQEILPSSIYIESNLRRLESLVMNYIPEETMIHEKLLNLLIFILITCALLMLLLLISCMFTFRKEEGSEKNSDETEQSLTTITTSNDETNGIYSSQLELYADLENHLNEPTTRKCFEPVNSKQMINGSSQATIRILTSRRPIETSQHLPTNIHSLGDHLSEIDSSEIIIIENLGAQNNRQIFYSEYGQKKLSVILYEQENNEFFNLSKLINHSNIVSCFGYVNVSPERCLLVSEYSRVNLFEHCQTMSIDDENTLTILMEYLNEIVSALIYLESSNVIIRDLTLPNCLLFDNNIIKLSDYAKQDDRYVSRYVQQVPIRWLPGDIVTKDEIWSIHTNTFMFGTLLFELFHLGSSIPYKDLKDDEVLQFYRDLWSHSKQNSIELSVLSFSNYFPRPILCNDRLYALIERCLSWSSQDRPSFREITLCLAETTTDITISQ